MPSALSFCRVCSKRFLLKPDEMALLAKGRTQNSAISPSARRARIGGASEPTTWSEWVEHVLSHCPEHRLAKMPEDVDADYAKRVIARTPPPVIKADENSHESDREEGETPEGDQYDTWFPRARLT